MSEKPTIAITMGDPAGIGPEICIRAVRDKRVLDVCSPLIFGDTSILEQAAGKGGLAAPETEHVRDIKACRQKIKPGKVQKHCGRAAYEYIDAAVHDALFGNVSAIATAPLQKEALNLAGIPFPGHTEILASLTKAKNACMMMASEKIIVTLATIHIGITEIPHELRAQRITTALELTLDALNRLGIPEPHITVCGLNPHAGENGLFGDEEEKIIKPAIKAADTGNAVIEGPVPADTAFVPAKLDETDAYIVMYHDQGLIPFKMLAFETGVNITLGLPIIRTSVDHGTAFDIAWQGKASHESMVQSILWAVKLAGGQH